MHTHTAAVLQHIAAGSCVFPAPAATYAGETCLQRQFGTAAGPVALLIVIVVGLVIVALFFGTARRILS